jgi:N-terminal acetyltransferase B complex catalytic subunit
MCGSGGRSEQTLIAISRYSVYRRVVNYYNDGEDAFDMRKPLSRDKDRKHVRENGEEFRVTGDDVW